MYRDSVNCISMYLCVCVYMNYNMCMCDKCHTEELPSHLLLQTGWADCVIQENKQLVEIFLEGRTVRCQKFFQ